MNEPNESSPAPETMNSRAGLQTVIDLVLKQERERKQRAVRRSEKRILAERRRKKLSDDRLRDAVHIIKWSVVGICSVMVIGLMIAVWALVQVEQAVVEVEREVEQVASRVDEILHEVEHPFEGAARLLGRDLDQSVADFFGLQSSSSTDAEK